MSTLRFGAKFDKTTAGKATGVNSLTVLWDIEQITKADGTRTAVTTGEATNITYGRRGLYGYLLTDAFMAAHSLPAIDLQVYDYVGTAYTAGDVDASEVSGINWDAAEGHDTELANLDAAVSSRSTLTAAQVWAYAERTLTSFGTLVATIWAYVSRTLTMTGEEILDALTGNRVTIHRGDDFPPISLTVGSLVGWKKIWVTGKKNRNDTDDQAIFQIILEEGTPDTGGLIVFNGTAISPESADAGITINDEATGAIDIDMICARTVDLAYLRNGCMDVQMADKNDFVTTKKEYTLNITKDITQSVV